MDSAKYEDILYDNRILSWSARILGTVEVAFLIYLSYDQIFKGIIERGISSLLPSIGGQYFLAVTMTLNFTGLIIAYWKEGLGGGLALASVIVLFIGWADFHAGFILGMGVVSLPSILYVVYCLSVRQAIKKAERDQTAEG